MCAMTNSTISQSDQLYAPIQASIGVCLIRGPQGLRVDLHAPPDLDRLLELIGKCCNSAEATWLALCIFICRCCSHWSDVPRVPLFDCECASVLHVGIPPPAVSRWRHWLKERGSFVSGCRCFQATSEFPLRRARLAFSMTLSNSACALAGTSFSMPSVFPPLRVWLPSMLWPRLLGHPPLASAHRRCPPVGPILSLSTELWACASSGHDTSLLTSISTVLSSSAAALLLLTRRKA